MQIIIDRTGFPLINIEATNFYIHLFPITKVQYERYISDPYDGMVDAPSYNEILKISPRVSVRKFIRAESWKLFATAILPNEIKRFGNWLGTDYRLPTQFEWKRAVNILKNMPTVTLYQNVYDQSGINPLVKTILDRLVKELSPQSGADLCVYFDSIMEWIIKEDKESETFIKNSYEYGTTNALIGKADQKIFSTLDHPDPMSPMVADVKKRINFAGFRLVKV